MNNKKSIAVIFIAVSSKPQADEDKDSLENQEAEARAYCHKNNLEVKTVLAVRGFPRSESDILTYWSDMESIGELAYHDLRSLWIENKARMQAKLPLTFDILVAWTKSRLGRSQSLLSVVMENVVKSGANIYMLHDGGLIDKSNYRMHIGVGGIQTSSEIDQFVAKTRQGMVGRAKQRLGPATLPFSHQKIRNSKGETIKIEVNEAYRSLFNHIKLLILEGVSLKNICKELYTRYGDVNPNTGVAFWAAGLVRSIQSPAWWGHSVYNMNRETGPWIYDDAVPVPPEITCVKHAFPSVWEGQDRMEVVAELNRRSNVVSGKTKAKVSFALSGLIVCRHCFRAYSCINKQNGYKYWFCNHNSRQWAAESCVNTRKSIPDSIVRAFVDGFIREAIDLGSAEAVFYTREAVLDIQGQIDNLGQELRSLDDEISQMFEQIPRIPKNLLDKFHLTLAKKSERQEILTAALVHANADLKQYVNPNRQIAYEELISMGENIWNIDPFIANKILAAFLGNSVIGVGTDKIIKLINREKPKKF